MRGRTKDRESGVIRQPITQKLRTCKFMVLLMGLGLLAASTASATVPVGLTLNPTTSNLRATQSQSFTATVTGATNTAVTWSMSPAVGTLVPNGNTATYTAPPTISVPLRVTITVTSAADPKRSAAATINMAPSIGISLSPATSTLNSSQAQALIATVTGSTNLQVKWSLNPATGTLVTNPSGNIGTYTAPATINSPETVTITATSAADSTKTASAVISLVPAIVVSLNASTATLGQSQAQSITATVTGASNTAVVWSMSPVAGSLTSTGNTASYTAPATISSPQTVIVTAASSADPTKTASAVISLVPPVVVSLSASRATLSASQVQSLTASVTGATNTAVTWSMSPATGSLTSSGNTASYTAPATLNSAQTVTITATSSADPTKTATVLVSLAPPVVVSLSSSTSTLNPSQIQSLTASVTGTTNNAVTWSLSPAVGSLATSGNTAVYAAPAIIISGQTVTVTATSMANPLITASALISLVPLLTVAVTPDNVVLQATATQQFSASVTGAANTAVNWSLNSPVGSVSSSGLYTAPANVASSQSVTLIAQSVANPSISAKSTLTVNPQPQVQFTVAGTGLTSLSYNGQNFFYRGAFLIQDGVWRTPAGGSSNVGWLSAGSSTQSAGINYFQQIYNPGQRHQFTVKVTYTAVDGSTLRADAQLTNQDPTDTLGRINLQFLPLHLPGPAGQYANNIPISIDEDGDEAVQFWSGAWGSAATWFPFPLHETIYSSYGSAAQTDFPLAVYNYTLRTFETSAGTKYYENPIGPGQTQTVTQFLRLGSASDTITTLVPDILNSYNSVFPSLVNWPDHRPIGNWFISEGTDRSALNPRGYLWDPTLDISNAQKFRDRMIAYAAAIVKRMNLITPKPQGIVIWDLEGQEFNHAMTYIGAPNMLSTLAPEMDLVADDVMNVFKQAGYKIGLTLRPMTFQTGTTFPATCHYSPTYYLADKFIKLDARPPLRGYICSAPNVWKQAGANYPGDQTLVDDDATILANLEAKVAYARNRWGATIFYVDSDVWGAGGPIYANIFRRLEAEFPDVLFAPEWSDPYYYGTAAPYRTVTQGVYQTPASAKDIYPNAFSVLNMSDANLTDPSLYQKVVSGVKGGDILMFRAWFDSIEIPLIQSIYSDATK